MTNATSGIGLQSGASSTDTTSLCAAIGGAGALANDVRGAWGRGAIGLRHRFAHTAFRIAGFHGDGANIAAITAFVSNANHNAAVTPIVPAAPASVTFTGGDPCTQPK